MLNVMWCLAAFGDDGEINSSLQYVFLNWTRVVRSFLIESLIGGGQSSNTTFLS